jgi:hypothetical protein
LAAPLVGSGGPGTAVPIGMVAACDGELLTHQFFAVRVRIRPCPPQEGQTPCSTHTWAAPA